MKLEDKIESHFPRLEERQKKALTKLKLETIRDLLFYFPSRYIKVDQITNIANLIEGENITIIGKIFKLKIKKSFKSKIPMGQAQVSDATGSINIVWFNQPYLAKMIKEGSTVKVSGKVSKSKSYGLTLTNPEVTPSEISLQDRESLFSDKNKINHSYYAYPVYKASRGITTKWFYHAIRKILNSDCVKDIKDYIPKDIVEKYKLPSLYSAIIWIHSPKEENDAIAAKKRFAFEEVFFIQLIKQKERLLYEALPSYKLKIPEKDIKDFISHFSFSPTKSQLSAIHSILEDLKLNKPMSRLLEGDVGSGKTFVAATIAYVVTKNRPFDEKKEKQQDFGNLQVAYMAPTEILATQLFENFIQYFKHLNIPIALITGKGCRKFPSKSAPWKDGKQVKTWTTISKNQLLKWVANGEIPIIIGTHSLISKTVEFKDLGLVIIDEQHRFGTNQRMKLVKKKSNGIEKAPHYLSMTATPIPRTLALTIYGDLDLSVIDEMPPGRKRIITKIVSESKRKKIYEEIREELKAGRQLYVVCPRIDNKDEKAELGQTGSGSLAQHDGASREIRQQANIRADRTSLSELRSVTSEAKRLKKEVFPEYEIEIMHSKMNKRKKEEVMKDFMDHKIDVLVSTSVIEVGVNVPNTTIIIIEGAERFGLAQLHQLRGRVMRSTYQSYCYLFSNSKTKKTNDRLRALTKASNGFKLAELDLDLRGAGLLTGDKQWGMTDLGMEAIRNIKMVEAARIEATRIVKDDLELKSSPNLAHALKSKNFDFHFE